MHYSGAASFPRLAVSGEGLAERREEYQPDLGAGGGCVGIEVKRIVILLLVLPMYNYF